MPPPRCAAPAATPACSQEAQPPAALQDASRLHFQLTVSLLPLAATREPLLGPGEAELLWWLACTAAQLALLQVAVRSYHQRPAASKQAIIWQTTVLDFTCLLFQCTTCPHTAPTCTGHLVDTSHLALLGCCPSFRLQASIRLSRSAFCIAAHTLAGQLLACRAYRQPLALTTQLPPA